MHKTFYPIGILISTTGSYGTVGRSILNGTLLACQQINADPSSSITLVPEHADPAGDLSAYYPAARELLDKGIRHVVGCYTSSSRKEVIPLFEKRDALLWHPAHYEGFESSSNVVYTGAAPNHHISPLMDFLLESYGKKAFCIGSNYIWGWESNRILREYISQRGGQVVAERYIPVGETDLTQIIEMIFHEKPDFVFNALIGSSSYAFFEQFRRACRARGVDQLADYPVASCNLTEPDLSEIAEDCRDGHLSSSVYFASLLSSENEAFITGYARSFPEGPPPSAESEAAYIATKFLGAALLKTGSDDALAARAAVAGLKMWAPQGLVTIDPETHHTFLTPRIGRSNRKGQFDILVEAACPVRPDPYLVSMDAPTQQMMRKTTLRVVS
ncbi:transporter substrate-binding protein [Labrys sp. KNU-23]|uniref:transporter substrate-binding domain-containing protein n=1 Tax=Labrys sp. KNU-23 TaxID=2789216 RepID=UPI0011EC7F0D|nr:transporter substrate-binding domain-containing protein [Labrys sp. KNU-23]QEN85098.1 transporter substrate-binding protein [Labrys sp. KNU-23]